MGYVAMKMAFKNAFLASSELEGLKH